MTAYSCTKVRGSIYYKFIDSKESGRKAFIVTLSSSPWGVGDSSSCALLCTAAEGAEKLTTLHFPPRGKGLAGLKDPTVLELQLGLILECYILPPSTLILEN